MCLVSVGKFGGFGVWGLGVLGFGAVGGRSLGL